MKKKVDGNFTLSVKEIPEVFPSWWWMGSAGARLSIGRGRPAWEQLSMLQGKGRPGQEHACAYPLFWQLIMDTGPALIHHFGLAPPVNFRSCLSSFCLPGILGGQKV